MPVANTQDAYRVGTTPIIKVYAGTVEVWPLWPTGLIVHHADAAKIPAGWAVCDGVTVHGSAKLKEIIGTDTTPNLVDMFVRSTSGGANTATLGAGHLPAHRHVMGTESVGHTHTGTSGPMSANQSHSHTVTLGNNNADHYHGLGGSATGTVSAWHEHSQLIFNEGDGGDGDGNWVDQSPTSQGATKDVGDTANPSANHYHNLPASNTDTISAWHQHAAYTAYDNPTHGHSFDVNDQTGTHTHSISAEGGGGAFSVVPEHYALIYIIKL